ncbi:hypothetical protein SLS62_007654 [Diatrype stigma]|uniref:Myb-like domain-containing protein n=1 Tax=Diatrype stigma TaxID=117547 RepID=A0AAN9UWF3_9PEZI
MAARLQALLEIGVPEILRLSENIHAQMKSIGDDLPSTADLMRLEMIKLSFDTWRNMLAKDDVMFINLEQTPFNHIGDDATSWANAERALCSVNLVSLLMAILKAKQGKADVASLIHELDDAFPVLFVPATQEHIDETFDLAFRIRCCVLAESLAGSPQGSALYLAANTFCEQAHVDAESAQEILEAGPYRQLANVNLNEDSAPREVFHKRLRQLLSQTSHGGEPEFRAFLDETYPQETLTSDLKTWAMNKLEQLIKQPVATSSERSVREGSDDLVIGGEEEQQDGLDSDSEETQSQAIHIPAFSGPQGSFFNHSITLEDVRRGQPGRVPPSNQQAAKGKQKATSIQDAIRSLDPQRVLGNLDRRSTPTSSNAPKMSNPTLGSALAPNQASTSKRPRPDDIEEDDDFEVNQRFAGTLGRRRRPANEDPPESPERTRPAPSRPPASSLEPRQERHGQPQPSAEEGHGFQEHHLKALSQGARANNVRAQASNKTRQTRTPWSPEDTDKLIDYIGKHRCSWSKIADEGDFDVPRDQQAVRDRARNVKTLMLRADTLLPAGFDLIALGKKERKQIMDIGRNPDRREDDVDEDGKVVNNIWVEQ